MTRVIPLGAGALGSVLAVALARAGAEVAIVDRDPAHVEAIRGRVARPPRSPASRRHARCSSGCWTKRSA